MKKKATPNPLTESEHEELIRLRAENEYIKAENEVINKEIALEEEKQAAPLQKWTADVSQFSFTWGKCYISPILDMNTNEIIAYDLSQTANLAQVQRMLGRAFKAFPVLDGLVFHSDRSGQYQDASFRNALRDHGIIQSMSRKGNCYDSCIMETFFGRMKNEMLYGFEKGYKSFEEFSEAVEKYIDYYNNERIQAKTTGMPPAKFGEASMS